MLEINRALISIVPTLTIGQLLQTNDKSARFGLRLTSGDAHEIIEYRNRILDSYGRIELSINVIRNIISEFCSSPYINAQNYPTIINELVDIFYYTKNEVEGRIGDNDLVYLMNKLFNGSCRGSTELLKNREMAMIIRIIKKSAEYSRGNE